MSISDIRRAIQHEDNATHKFSDFKVLSIERDNKLLRLTLQERPIPGVTPNELDDNLNGSVANWKPGGIEGSATVRWVNSDTGLAVLDKVNGPLPHSNQDIRLTSPDYIWPLKKCWQDDEWAEKAVACLKAFASPTFTQDSPLSSAHVARLRPAQRNAFGLVNVDPGFIWGPPGTGKTTTAGELLAAYLAANPQARVLVLCATNRAVDEAAIAVDNALVASGQFLLRFGIKRLGPGYDRKKFETRQHLLPESFSELSDAATQNTSSSGVRMLALTINRAISTLGTLRKEAAFDLLFVDESSQVSLPNILALMPLGKVRLFAGDPYQLPPIYRAKSACAKRWMAESVFSYMPAEGSSVCLLNEQSRMAPPISDLVSQISYNGELRVAQDALNDRDWLESRKVRFADIPRSQHVVIRHISTNSTRAQGSRKYRRMESAQQIMALIQSAIANRDVAQEDIVVVTAFRKQASIIRAHLFAERLFKVKVDTVHRSQGIERPVVIFDPMDGMHDLLKMHKGKQLINVAMSRAQSKLIMLLSTRDMKNPIFKQIAGIVHDHNNRPTQQITQVLSDPMFLTSAIGKRVDIQGQVADITRFSRDGAIMWADIEATGLETIFNTYDLMMTSQ
jgi:hypothetical protein